VATVETVRGPVEAESLGRTLPHEHVFILGHETLQNFNHRWGEPWWDEEARVADAVAKLQRLRDGGIETIYDPTAVGLGRDIGRIKRINEQVDLNVVVCTGIYSFMELPQFLRYRTPEALAAIFVRELTEGIGDTGVKAAFIKCAVEEYGLVGEVPKILAAVATAAIETGARDGATFHDFMVGDPFFEREEADYLHVTNVILPQLRERGLADADIDRIMVENPVRWLAG
jgi:phosphotriesterase-related protein